MPPLLSEVRLLMPIHYTTDQFASHAAHPSFLRYKTVRSSNYIRVYCVHDLDHFQGFMCTCHWGPFLPTMHVIPYAKSVGLQTLD
jgi:hypothetical protein